MFHKRVHGFVLVWFVVLQAAKASCDSLREPQNMNNIFQRLATTHKSRVSHVFIY